MIKGAAVYQWPIKFLGVACEPMVACFPVLRLADPGKSSIPLIFAGSHSVNKEEIG